MHIEYVVGIYFMWIASPENIHRIQSLSQIMGRTRNSQPPINEMKHQNEIVRKIRYMKKVMKLGHSMLTWIAYYLVKCNEYFACSFNLLHNFLSKKYMKATPYTYIVLIYIEAKLKLN